MFLFQRMIFLQMGVILTSRRMTCVILNWSTNPPSLNTNGNGGTLRLQVVTQVLIGIIMTTVHKVIVLQTEMQVLIIHYN